VSLRFNCGSRMLKFETIFEENAAADAQRKFGGQQKISEYWVRDAGPEMVVQLKPCKVPHTCTFKASLRIIISKTTLFRK
jgi:hypothetical protein